MFQNFRRKKIKQVQWFHPFWRFSLSFQGKPRQRLTAWVKFNLFTVVRFVQWTSGKFLLYARHVLEPFLTQTNAQSKHIKTSGVTSVDSREILYIHFQQTTRVLRTQTSIVMCTTPWQLRPLHQATRRTTQRQPQPRLIVTCVSDWTLLSSGPTGALCSTALTALPTFLEESQNWWSPRTSIFTAS